MTDLIIATIIFLGVFTQSLSGFGLGLVTMPLLVEIIDLKFASSLMPLIGFTTLISLSLYHKSEFSFKSVLPLIMGSICTIPVGIFLVKKFDSDVVVIILGIVIVSYAIYSLLNFPLPQINSPKLGYVFGLMSGVLSGAYNTGGPPAVIYGNCCRWQPQTFKSNLSGFFLVNTMVLNLNHLIQGNLNQEVLRMFLLNIPSLFFALFTGLFLSKFVNQNVFRKIVLFLLLFSGLKLLFL